MNGQLGVLGAALTCFMLIGLAPAVLAQAPGENAAFTPQAVGNAASSTRPPHSPEWGTSAPIAYNIPGWTFNNVQASQHGIASLDYYTYNSGGGNGMYNQTLYLPSGAFIEGVTHYFYDVDPNASVFFYFTLLTGNPLGGFVSTPFYTAFSATNDGYQGSYYAVQHTVRNVDPATGDANMYILTVAMNPSNGAALEALKFGGVTVWYRLQTGPAPATATFSDVPTGHWAFQYIEALVASGITAGCGGGKYCPDNPITRAQMAVYLADALGLHWADGSPQ